MTQGLAAATGFTLGLTKALAAVFLYEVITANITEPAAPAVPAAPTISTQEICFGTRSARSLKEAEAVVEAYSSRSNRDHASHPTSVRRTGNRRYSRPLRKYTLKDRNGKSYRRRRRPPPRNKIDFNRLLDTTKPATSETETRAATGTGQTSGTGTTGTGTQTGTGAGAGLGSTVSSTTSTGNEEPPTCIVIQKQTK